MIIHNLTLGVVGYLKNQSEKYDLELKRILDALTMAVLPITVGLFTMSENIIQLVGGKQYLAGNAPLKILSLAIIFAIYSSLYTNCVLVVNNREKYCLISTLISASANIVLNFILLPVIGGTGAAITTLLAESLNCILQMWFGRDIFRFSITSIFKANWKCTIGSLEIILICVFSNMLISNYIIRLGVAILTSIIAYAGTLYLTKYDIFIDVLHGVQRRKNNEEV